MLAVLAEPLVDLGGTLGGVGGVGGVGFGGCSYC